MREGVSKCHECFDALASVSSVFESDELEAEQCFAVRFFLGVLEVRLYRHAQIVARAELTTYGLTGLERAVVV